MKGNTSLNPLFCLFIPQELFLSSPSLEFTFPPPPWPRLNVAFFSGSSNLKGVSYDTQLLQVKMWWIPSAESGLYLACKLETHFDKFHMECRQLLGSNPFLLVNVSAECIDDQNSSVTPGPSRQILSCISSKVLQEISCCFRPR